MGLRSVFRWTQKIMDSPKARWAQVLLIILMAAYLSTVVVFMIKNHPYQHLYFNRLAGRDMKEIKERFDLDYWGLSYNKALEYIAKHDKDPLIKIYIDPLPRELNIALLDRSDQQRLVFVNDFKEAKYLMSNYRWHKQDYSYPKEYYSIKIDQTSIMSVYRL
jgi:hypothetical protein